jgi:hypothetical protein
MFSPNPRLLSPQTYVKQTWEMLHVVCADISSWIEDILERKSLLRFWSHDDETATQHCVNDSYLFPDDYFLPEFGLEKRK